MGLDPAISETLPKIGDAFTGFVRSEQPQAATCLENLQCVLRRGVHKDVGTCVLLLCAPLLPKGEHQCAPREHPDAVAIEAAGVEFVKGLASLTCRNTGAWLVLPMDCKLSDPCAAGLYRLFNGAMRMRAVLCKPEVRSLLHVSTLVMAVADTSGRSDADTDSMLLWSPHFLGDVLDLTTAMCKALAAWEFVVSMFSGKFPRPQDLLRDVPHRYRDPAALVAHWLQEDLELSAEDATTLSAAFLDRYRGILEHAELIKGAPKGPGCTARVREILLEGQPNPCRFGPGTEALMPYAIALLATHFAMTEDAVELRRALGEISPACLSIEPFLGRTVRAAMAVTTSAAMGLEESIALTNGQDSLCGTPKCSGLYATLLFAALNVDMHAPLLPRRDVKALRYHMEQLGKRHANEVSFQRWQSVNAECDELQCSVQQLQAEVSIMRGSMRHMQSRLNHLCNGPQHGMSVQPALPDALQLQAPGHGNLGPAAELGRRPAPEEGVDAERLQQAAGGGADTDMDVGAGHGAADNMEKGGLANQVPKPRHGPRRRSGIPVAPA